MYVNTWIDQVPRPPRRRKLRRAPMPKWGRALPPSAVANKVLSDERAMLLVLDTLLELEIRA